MASVTGLIVEKTLIRFLYGRPYESILATWGLSLVMQQGARNVFGANNVDVSAPHWLQGGVRLLADFQLPYSRIFILSLAVAAIAGMYLYVNYSVSGRRMRAVMQNRGMAACMGVSTRKVDSLTFAIGSGIAGIAGCAVSLLGSIGPSTGQNYIVDAFMVVVLGGVGNLAGTVAGALMIGLTNPFFEYATTSSMGKVIVFTLVIVFLQWKPSGFFSLKTRALD
jgi:urea transport system permease protein